MNSMSPVSLGAWTVSQIDPDVTIICGGTGGSTVVDSLAGTGLKVAAVVTPADDGGSTGLLRKADPDMLGLGDLRAVIEAAMRPRRKGGHKVFCDLFGHRFERGLLKGHALGNLILAALVEMHDGSVPLAIQDLRRFMDLSGLVLPSTQIPVRLCVEFANGEVVCGEHHLDNRDHRGELPVIWAWLVPEGARARRRAPVVRANFDAVAAILKSRLVVLGPGSLYGSVIASLLPMGISEALHKTEAHVAAVLNLTTHPSDSAGLSASESLRVLEDYASREIPEDPDRRKAPVIQTAIVNDRRPSTRVMESYREEGQELLRVDPENFPDEVRVVRRPLLCEEGGTLRHDPAELRRVLEGLLANLSVPTP